MKNIKKINYDNGYFSGCETCDYGSSYTSDVEILFEDDTYLRITTDQMYEYMVTEQDYMIAISHSNNEEELILNLLNIIKDKSYEIEHRVNLQCMEIKINGKEINILRTLNRSTLVYK